MFKASFSLVIALFSLTQFSAAQKIEVLTIDLKSSIRGLSVVTDQILWASGSKGKVGKSLDGGKTWKWMDVPGFEKNEFRDIEAFDANTAVIMAITEPAQILRTSDGGQNWKLVFADTAKGMFYDAMDFADENNGVVIGDPLPGSNYIYRAYTRNGGAAWFRPKDDSLSISPVQKGEAMFASSGSNVAFLKSDGFLRNNKMWIVTGGTASNLLSQNPISKTTLPILQGKESTGANSIAYFNSKEFIVVGGDFANDKDSTMNCILSRDGGLSFIKPYRPPHGYKSCVEYISRTKLVACGTSGVDVSGDGGMTWDNISTDGYHVCIKAKKGNTVFLAGNGKIAKLVW
jgi:photosystem II stability/assembly factor-like uncharacterized protein